MPKQLSFSKTDGLVQLKKPRPEKYFFRVETQLGLTLLELLVSLSIIAILTATTLPPIGHLVRNTQAKATLESLRKGIASARGLALNNADIVTLCPGAENECSKEWRDTFKIFVDSNNNAEVDNEESIFESIKISKGSLVAWRASGGVSYLKFSPTGIARQFGRFYICDSKGSPKNSQAMVINRQGRVRVYRDRDKNGIVEDIDGREPICPD